MGWLGWSGATPRANARGFAPLHPSHPAPQARARASSLYHAYVEWSRDNGLEPMTARKFGSEMEQRGFPLVKSNGRCWRAGLRVKQPDREGGVERTPF